MQKTGVIQPKFLNLDVAFSDLKPNESPFISNLTFDENANPYGTPVGRGQNEMALTPVASNQSLGWVGPRGYNKNIGIFYSETTQETYFLNYNGNGQHGIYVVYGDTKTIAQIIVDPELGFTDNQNGFMPSHRASMRTFLDKSGNVVEKILLLTDGNSWQKWILVDTAIQTGGFNAQLFPYWTLQPPHFDRRELLEWAIRPPMYCPTVVSIPNTPANTDQVNRVIDTAFQFAYSRQNTDGRVSVFSPYSLPFYIKSEDYLNNPNTLPKNLQITLDGGSPLTEAINIYVRKNALDSNSIPSITEWSDWYLYDTIYKFSGSSTSESAVIGTPYWERNNPWQSYNYNQNLNQIQYTFDNSKVLQIIDQKDAAILQNDIPQLSVSLSDLGDAEGLANNRRDYDNLPQSVLSNISAKVLEKTQVGCSIPTRTIQLYAHIGMPIYQYPFPVGYPSQVGYYNGSDTQMRFGGLTYGAGASAGIDFNVSKTFDLNFADQDAFRCYLKGTPYYEDGQWYQVNSDFSLVKIQNLLDFSNPDVLEYVRNVFIAGGFFVCVFTFTVPAGRYIATIGRHNVESTGDFRNTSTYIYGIANSRITDPFNNSSIVNLTPGAIQNYSKEMEIDCTAGDIDVWGNGHDIFYIYCPNISSGPYRFIEGYLQESPNSPLGMELYPYNTQSGSRVLSIDHGVFTDKNGFYWSFVNDGHADVFDVYINGTINCVQSSFDIRTSVGGIGWRPNPTAYFSDHNNGRVGDCNRVLLNGRITSLDGSIGYSNVSISIKDGATVLSDQNGDFTLIIHNGFQTPRVSNVYVNSGGNFIITVSDCGYLPIRQYSELIVPCFNCIKRVYPVPFNLAIFIQNTSQTSLKQGGEYSVGCLVGDLAGRLSFVNIKGEYAVPSFIERGDTLATFLQLLFNGPLNLNKINPDWKWFAPCVSSNLTDPTYIEWVGDYIKYIDNNGNVVTDPSTAVYCSISIQSLYNNNVQRNFSTLANYQFTLGDRLRIYDDGDGHLLTGNPIDLRILGQNYNQAAQTAGLIPSTSTVPIINNNISSSTSTSVTDGSGTTTTTLQTQQNSQNITLYVLYDPRLTPLINDTGFWIEIYTPAEQASISTFSECQGFYPIINGEVCSFGGYANGAPIYNLLNTIPLQFWDTYLFNRNITIPNVGDKFISHPFESPNISDTFGYNITSGGRQNVNNIYAKQMWYKDEVSKSDDFVGQGLLNGIGTFRSTNRKVFKDFRSGGIVAMKALRNLVAFICENDYFITDYSFQYIYANQQGIQIANLDNNLGSPHQKIGDAFGCAYEDTSTILFFDKFVFWYDYKNEAFVQMGWGPAVDITRFDPSKGTQGYISSYFIKKTQFIKGWNSSQTGNGRLFDVVVGADYQRNNIYITFRPRRSNSNDLRSYFNGQRNKNLKQQETIVYNLPSGRFVRFTSFTPEGYGILKGLQSGLEMLAFAAGGPYIHNNTGNKSFCNFFGLQATPCFAGVLNESSGIVKVLQNISVDSIYNGYYVDEIFSEEKSSFSYIPANYFKRKENQYYAPVLRNMSSYPSPNVTTDALYRSTLTDSAGKRIFGRYFIARFISTDGNSYSELQAVYYQYSASESVKK